MLAVEALRLRWVGHRMYGELRARVSADASFAESQRIASAIQHEAGHVVPQLEEADRAAGIGLATCDVQATPEDSAKRMSFSVDKRPSFAC